MYIVSVELQAIQLLTCVLCFLQNEADRTLIYVTLYISECLKRLQKVNFTFVNVQQ